MRLIHCRSLQLKEFVSSDVPEYAILSHTWESDEVSFAAFTTDLTAAKLKAGFCKIDFTCQQAIAGGLEYAWVDTSCIDKSSSAELAEAINSMFTWYNNASVCYVYLSDVTKKDFDEQFPKSRWFQRGWALQELIAPDKVIFFDSAWNGLGSKEDRSWLIHDITQIDETVLRTSMRSHSLQGYCIAKRMAWASQRTTTRIEDMAYCLLGIFDVNMPLLYGEGYKAFHRLQLEIIKVVDDDSILAWGKKTNALDFNMVKCMVEPMDDEPAFGGLFARSPEDFANCHDTSNSMDSISPYTMTNQGLDMELPLVEIVRRVDDDGLYVQKYYPVGLLTCKTSTASTLLGILLADADISEAHVNRVTIDSGTYRDPDYATTLLVGPRLATQAVSRKITVTNPMERDTTRGRSKTHEQILVNQSKTIQSFKYTATFEGKCLYFFRKDRVMHLPATWDSKASVITISEGSSRGSLINIAFEADCDNRQCSGFSVLIRRDNAIVRNGS